jgi:hypothetical protein
MSVLPPAATKGGFGHQPNRNRPLHQHGATQRQAVSVRKS